MTFCKRLFHLLLAGVLLLGGVLPYQAEAAPAPWYSGSTFYYGQENILFNGDLTPSGLGPDDERWSIAYLHQNQLYNVISGSRSSWQNDMQFDIQEDPSQGDWEDRFVNRRGYLVIPKNQSIIKQLAQQANGNPDFVWDAIDGETDPYYKDYTVNGKPYIDYGSVIRLSGGGNPNQTKHCDPNEDSACGVDDPIFTTVWQITPFPIHNAIKYNGTTVVTNSKVVNSGFELPANQTLQVTVDQTTFGANGTQNEMKVYIDGVLRPEISSTRSFAGGPEHDGVFHFQISGANFLTPGKTYLLEFEAIDSFGRITRVGPVPYTVVASGPCTPIQATLKISGESDQTIASGGGKELPEGKNTATLVFPQAGTLRVNGQTVGTGNTFSGILVEEQTEIQFTPTNATYCTFSFTLYPGAEPVKNCDYTIHVDVWTSTGQGEISVDMPSDTDGAARSLRHNTDMIVLSTGKSGTFKLGSAVVGRGKYVEIESFPKNGDVFTLSFESDDGEECWVEKFYLDRGDFDITCPWVEIDFNYEGLYIGNLTKVGNGTVRTNVELNDYWAIRSFYRDENGEKQPAPVYWRLKRPDGSTVRMNWTEHERPSQRKPWPTDWLYTRSETPEGYFGFDIPGTYELEYFIDANRNPDWAAMGCTWKMTIVVTGCEDLRISAKLNGTTYRMVRNVDETQSGRYFYDVKLPADRQTNTLEFTMKRSTYEEPADWELVRVSDGAVIHRLTNAETFTYTIAAPGQYKLYVKKMMGSEPCQFVVTITQTGCDALGAEAILYNEHADITGSGTASDPYRVKMTAGQNNQIRLHITDGEKYVTTGLQWTLKRGNTVIHTTTNSRLEYTLPPSTQQYSVHVRINYEDAVCEKYFVFEAENLNCNDIYMHFYDPIKEAWQYNVAPGPGHTATITLKANTVDIGFVVTDKPNAIDNKGGATIVPMDWQATLPNQFDPTWFAYYRKNVSPGTYTIKAVVNADNGEDSGRFAALNGCTFTLTLVVDPESTEPPPCTNCNPGGDVDGGQMQIRLFDSDNRQLTQASDGVWEREPVRIEVTIDQSRINAAFTQVNQQIQRAIEAKKAEFLTQYDGEPYEDVEVTATPSAWDARTDPQTSWPSTVPLTVTGPGVNQTYSLQPKQQVQSVNYTGTTVPTFTTWLASLHHQDYVVQAEGFTIEVPYTVRFTVTYQECEMVSPGEDPETGEPLPPEKHCVPGTDSGEISGTFHIQITGDQARFEVFEPNARGVIHHTQEWLEYHARDRYKNSQPHHFYAGERILARVLLESRHRHPYSGKYPVIQGAQAWIHETGQRTTLLQSLLSLQAQTATQWGGPKQMINKLGMREVGVDTPLMGDKQRGFQQGKDYAVYFQVRFAFGVSKGFGYPQKTGGTGHDPADYRAPFHIIGNAWERQGIRNHVTH